MQQHKPVTGIYKKLLWREIRIKRELKNIPENDIPKKGTNRTEEEHAKKLQSQYDLCNRAKLVCDSTAYSRVCVCGLATVISNTVTHRDVRLAK